MIEARNLTKRYGRFLAVDSIDFEIPRGRIVGFLGPNGAGKTTTIRMLTGYLPPTDGRITIDRVRVDAHSTSVRHRIGYLPEATPLYPEMRVSEYLGFRARIFGLPRRRRRAMIDDALKRCWLTDVVRRPIGQLSKGYRQRVGLAAALLHDPPVLILDEPTSGLDPSQIKEVRTLIRELAGRHTVLLSSHILPNVEQTCDSVLLIARGRIWARGTIDELRDQAAGDTAYIIETTSETLAASIQQLPQVSLVQPRKLDREWTRLSIMTKPDVKDARGVLWQSIQTAHAEVREFHRQAPSLEELFIRIVSEAEAKVAAEREQGAAA